MSRDPSTYEAGEVFAGRYRILEKLGEGAMGAVFLAEHVHIGRRDAIKVLRPGLSSDGEAIARFERGARNVSAINHPNVCMIYDFSATDEGVRYLAMEYVPGPTLKDLLDAEGALPAARALDIARQTAAGLQAAHEAGIVHRDLKPGNIMIGRGRDGADAVKVVDFDIAKGSEEGGDEVTRHGFVVGTPEYMSPEQLMGEKLDGRSDLYSLGIVLFRMLTGAQPFRAESTQDLMIARLTTTPLRLDEVAPALAAPAPVQAALDRVLQRRPEDRPASALQFAAELTADPASGPGAVPPAVTGAPAAPPPPVRVADTAPATVVAGAARPAVAPRPRRLMAAVGAAAVLVAAVGAFALLKPDPQREPAAAPDVELTPPEPPAGGGVAAEDVVTGTQEMAEARVPEVREAPRDVPQSIAPAERTAPPMLRDAGTARAVLSRQIDVLMDEALGSRRAAADTLEIVWRERALLPVPAQAATAAALGDYHQQQRDWERCAAWYSRAFDLNGSEFHRELRDRCRDRTRGLP